MSIYLAPHLAASEAPLEFVKLSFSYLEAAERLSSLMLDHSWCPSFRRGQVLLFLTFHATELFVKGCILKAEPSSPVNGHSLRQLTKRFEKLYPSLKLEVPFGVEVIPQAITAEVQKKVNADERKIHERFRYPIDTSGNPWGGVRRFEPDSFYKSLKSLRVHFENLRYDVFDKIAE